jgi:hypothetical protein
MSKREEKRKLELRRERLRQLTSLSTEDAGQALGGDWSLGDEYTQAGRVYSYGCRNHE